MPIAPRIVSSDGVYRSATWQNVTIADIAGDMDPLRMAKIARMHMDLAKAFPGGIVSCTIIRPGVPVGSSESREVAAQFLKELGDGLKRSALIMEETGLMAQVLRTFVRGLNIVTRNTKLVLCKNIDEAVGSLSSFIVPTQPGSNVGAELAAAVAQVRSDYAPRPVQQVAQR
jgi:hypothetical protein